MKKKIISLITLLACTALVVSCNNDNSGETPNSGNNNYGDVSGGNNDGSVSSDNSGTQGETNSALDEMIAAFVSGTDVKVPSTASYNIENYATLYYYAYEMYLIYAEVEDPNEVIADSYAATFTADTNLANGNDEDYTVEDYGYYYIDADQNVFVNFYSDDGYFVMTIYRYDGLYGTLDVSKVDTNWYVDYVNFGGYELVDTSIVSLIPNYLEINEEISIPNPTAPYLAGFEEPSTDENGFFVPAHFCLVLEGDQLEAYADAIEKAGYRVTITENVGTTIDWDTFELVDYTYYTVSAFDSQNRIYVAIELDESGNTAVSFYRFDDLFTNEKTSDTDWTDAEKELMNSKLHQLLPFMAFGDDYLLYDASDEEWTLLVLQDSYYEDLSEDYINLLLANGYVIDDVTWEDTYYVYDNGIVYIEILVTYDAGNYLEIYYEESHLDPLTSLGLSTSALDIVAGASYQLKPVYNPSTATHPVSWSSSDENVATVDNNGLVTIKSGATVNSMATITATAGGKTATCTFTVKANEVTGIMFNENSYDIIPGGDKVKVTYSYLPYGATSSDVATFSIDPSDAGIHIDANGDLYADSTVSVGTTVTLKATFNGSEVTASVKVISANITTVLTGTFFGIPAGNSQYDTYSKTVDGATYEAQASAGNNADGGKGLQIRSKNSNSGVIGSCEGRTCKSITFTFDSNTQADRSIVIYASNTPFAITDMYKTGTNIVGTINYDANHLTQTYTFTDEYAYIGFRSSDGALYLKSVEVVW